MALNKNLADARNEMKEAMNSATQRLAAAEGRNEYMSTAAKYIEMLERVLEGTGGMDSAPMLKKLVLLRCLPLSRSVSFLSSDMPDMKQGVELDRKVDEGARQAAEIERMHAVVSQLEEQVGYAFTSTLSSLSDVMFAFRSKRAT